MSIFNSHDCKGLSEAQIDIAPCVNGVLKCKLLDVGCQQLLLLVLC